MTRCGVSKLTVRLVVVAAVACGGGAVEAQTQVPVAPVALSGQTAPGAGASTFFVFNQPVLNNAGTSAFSAFITGAASTEDFGIWVGSAAGGFSLAAREGHAAPGTGGANFLTISQPLLDASGQIAFFALLQGSGVDSANNIGLWVGSPSGVSLAARTGDAAPGFVGSAFDFVSESALIAAGQVSFYGSVATGGSINGGNDDGIWAGTAGSLQLVAREGTPAPGTGAGVNYGPFNVTPVINTAGQVAFRTSLTGAVTAGVNDKGIWAGAPGSVQLVARAGDAAPALVGPDFLDFSTQPAINAAGTVAFRATVTGSGVDSSNDTGIWIGSNTSNLAVLAREKENAPGLGGVKYGQFSDFVVLNSSGQAAFVAQLQSGGVDGTNNKAIFSGPLGGVTVVARKGNQAPGTPTGVLFNDFDSSVALNSGGQVAFLADLTGSGIVSGNNRGIWAVDPFGQVVKVAREGDAITVSPGDVRTIGDVGLGMFINSGGGEGRWTSFNDSSQVTYSAFFTNNTRGVFNARVGGAARLSSTAPIHGPATTNGYGTGTPVPYYTTTAVSGDIGYLRFVGVAPAGQQVQILLDFSVASVIANAVAELNRSSALFGYSVAPVSIGSFDVMLTFAGAGTGTTPSHFYWNFANLDNVDLVAIQVAPEPGTIGLLTVGMIYGLARRRRSV
jgi:hypothetical protein